MEGLLERLARLSLKKSSKLLKKGGKLGGQVAGEMAAPGIGGYFGAQAGEALGGGVASGLDALSQVGQRNPTAMQLNNLDTYQQRPTFAQNWAGGLGEALGGQGANMLGDYMQGKIPGRTPENEEEQEEELTPEQQVEALLEGLSPESRMAILSKYSGAQ